MERDFWSAINNRGKVNANLLVNDDVRIVPIGDKRVVLIIVPRSSRRQRPIFVGLNPLEGTYRRYSDGDYLCSRDEVGRMLADQSEDSHDARIVEHFSLADLDPVSLRQYRNLFSARSPNHPWLTESDQGLLTKLGCWREDRATGRTGVTVAGLLMFGKDESIRDPAAVPQYQISYREKLSADTDVRWTDRLTIDGTWVANLFQFYQRVSVLLPRDVLKTPFALDPKMVRIDDTPAHQALREALVNALIHADYGGQGGIVIEKRRDRFDLSNPGSLLISFDQVVRGGVSECRNKSLQLMFLLVGGGEREGSGIDKIRQSWASQNLQSPAIVEQVRPDRVRLLLPTVSLLPGEVIGRLRHRFGKVWDRLTPVEVRALVLADTEGEVANARLRLVTDHHAADLTLVLQGLVGKGLLVQQGQKRGTTYQLPNTNGGVRRTMDNGGSPPDNGGSPPENDISLLKIATAARENRRLPQAKMRQMILRLCQGRYLTASQLAKLLIRNAMKLRDRSLSPLCEEGRLARRFPREPNRPDQAYTTKGPT